MRKVLAIAAIAVRNAVRSRVVASLLFALAVTMVGLPLTLKGDGTPEGEVQVLLNYTLGLAALILSLASLWAGCAAVSTEIADKQVQLVAVKPVNKLHIWLGKWLGLMFVNGSMLLLAGAAAYGLLLWRTGPERFSAEDRVRLERDVLVARRSITAPAPDVEQEALKLLQDRMARGEMPAGMTPETALEAVKQQLVNRANTVPPGYSKRWTFDVPGGPAGPEVTVRFRFAASRLGPAEIPGVWAAGTPDSPAMFRIAATNIAGAMQQVKFPGDLASHRTVTLDYENADTNGLSIVFAAADGPTLLVQAGAFLPNLARALLALLAHLAFMSAIGVTAGSLFSMPVAALLSLFSVLVLQLSDYIAEAAREEVLIPWHEGARRGANWADVTLRFLYKGLHTVTAPLQGHDVLGELASGRLIDWLVVGDAVLIQVLVAGGLLAALGAYVFSRRELALPA